MSIVNYQVWLDRLPCRAIERPAKPLSDSQWEQSWADVQRRISLRGLLPGEVGSLWIFGSSDRITAFLDKLIAELGGLKEIVVIDSEHLLRAHCAGLASSWGAKHPRISLELSPVSGSGWVEQYSCFAEKIQESGLHPRTCLPLDLSQGNCAMVPSLRAANELLLGYGLSSGEELIEAFSRDSRCAECLEKLIRWCAYLNSIEEYLPCALLGVPLYALSLQPALGTLLVSVFSNLGCPKLALEWLAKSDLDYRSRKEFAHLLEGTVQDCLAQADKQRDHNFRRLASKLPHLASVAESMKAPGDLHFVYAANTPWCAPPRGSQQPTNKVMLPVLVRSGSQSLEFLANLDSAFIRQLQDLANIRAYRCVVGNIAALDVLANLELDEFKTSTPNWSKEVCVVVEHPKMALKLLELDHPAIDLLFQDWVRVVWGPGGQQHIASEISTSITRAVPSLRAGLRPSIQRQLTACVSQRQRLLRDYLRSVKLVRQGKGPRAMLDKLDRGETLNILVPSSIHTSVLQYVAKDLCRAFEELGHNAKLLIEADGRHEVSPAVWAETMQSFSPDVVVFIDVLRASLDPLVPDHIPTLCWILDEMPRLEDPGTISRISASDLTFVWGHHLVEKYKGTLGYPHCQTLPFAVSPEVYYPDKSIVPSDSLAYVTNVGEVGEPKGYPGLWSRLTQEFKLRGNARLDVGECKTLLLSVFEQGAWGLPDSGELSFLSFQACQYARWHDRVGIAKALARAGIALALYGKGWDKIPELAKFSKGSVAQGAELSRVYQSHKVVLHINRNCNVHPRVLECMLAGTLVIARSNGEDDRAQGGLNDYLEIDREICVFEKVEDLVGIIHRAFQDEAWRRNMISAGQARARRDHSYLARARAMLEEFRRVLGQSAQTSATIRRPA